MALQGNLHERLRSLPVMGFLLPHRVELHSMQELNWEKLKKRERYQKNRAKILDQKREYYKLHSIELKKKAERYRQNNQKLILEKAKVYSGKHKKHIKKYQVKYRRKNDKNLKQKKKEYYKKHLNKIRVRGQKYYIDNLEKITEYHKTNRYKTRLYIKNRLATRPDIRLATNMRKYIAAALKQKYIIKKISTLNLLGITFAEFRIHIEKQFKPGMSWDNYGYYGWHVDHIMPLKAFDLRKLSEQKKAFHYKNLQPLWAKENLTKSAKILPPKIN